MSVRNQRLTERCCKLYGRQKELETICNAIQNAKDSKQIIMVSGPSGVGKTKLVETALESTTCLYGHGKFERNQQYKPYGALLGLFSNLCSNMTQESYGFILQETLDEDDTVFLANLLPPLLDVVDGAKVIAKSYETRNAYSKEGKERLKYTLKLFLKALSTSPCPVVLVLEDLQWIDLGSLDILRYVLLSGNELRNLVLLGSYRDNEVEDGDPLSSWLTEMNSDFVAVRLENFDISRIHEFLCDFLRVDDARDLANIIHSRTNGNMFHVLQLIDYLQEERLLEYSLVEFRWIWSVNDILEKTVLSSNVVDIVRAKMNRLEDQEQAYLKLCACLGFHFDESILVIVKDAFSDESLTDVVGSLQRLENAGLVERIDTTRLKFSHDEIYRTALLLFENKDSLVRLQLKIGMALWDVFIGSEAIESVDIEDRVLFLIADELNPCHELIRDNNVRWRLAKLNCVAAKRAASLSAFIPSAFYLESGLNWMNRRTMWTDDYALSLELNTLLAEMCLCSGNYERLKEAANEVLDNSRLVDDRRRVNHARITALIHEASLYEAIDISLQVLKELGEKIPKDPNRFQVRRAVDKLRKCMSKSLDEDILNLPPMTDVRKAYAVAVLSDLVFMTFERQENLSILCSCRVLELTLEYGLAPDNAVGFGHLSLLFMRECDMEIAYRFSVLSKKVLTKSQEQHHPTRARFLSNVVASSKEPYSRLLDEYMACYQSGMKSGDIWFAFASVFGYTQIYHYSGLPLGPLAADLEKYCALGLQYRQKSNLLTIVPLFQYVRNLMGKSNDILDLSQGVVAEYREKLGWENRNGARVELALSMQLSVHCGAWQQAREIHEKIEKEKDLSRGFFVFSIREFFAALIAIEFSRQTKKRKWKAQAKGFCADIRRAVTEKNINFTHKLQILEAECMSLEGKHGIEELRTAYDKAIVASSKCGFLQDAGLASMLASRALPEFEDLYFVRACELYSSWGATGLVEYLTSKRTRSFPGEPPERHPSTTRGFRGRERYDMSLAESHRKLDASEKLSSGLL